jgi:muconolactone D-isomerase
MEYLVTMSTHVPDGTSEGDVHDIRTRESARSRDLATEGHLLRLWRPPLQPGEWRTLGLFVADDGAELERVLASMPLRVWRTDEVKPLSPHPNDPARQTEKPGSPAPEAGGSEFLTTFTVAVPQMQPPRPSMPPPSVKQIGRVSSPSRDTWSGSGSCPARAARWAFGTPPTFAG